MISHPLLERAAKAGVRLGLDRIRTFLEQLGDPHLAAPTVHVAGTNGKGSVCAMVTAALVHAGYRVGTTISPHLEHVNERIQIDGVPVDDVEFDGLVEHVAAVRDRWVVRAGLEAEALTYYELAIAAAFLAFARRRVDVQVVEVGLGGRLDATNVVQPTVCAITHIGLDHQDVLGPDIATIAAEKGGIIKAGAPVVIGPVVPEARQVLVDIADRVGAPWWAPPETLRLRHEGSWLVLASPAGEVGPLRLGLRGAHQAENAMVALGVLHRLREQGLPVSDGAVVAGLAEGFIPGRLEEVRPGLVLDGAHNPDGARALAEWLARRPRPESGPRILLFGMGAGRPATEVLGPLLPWVDEVVTTRCAHPRAREPEELAREVQQAHPKAVVRAAGPIERALPEALSGAGEVVVTGSLFVAGAARTLLRQASTVPTGGA